MSHFPERLRELPPFEGPFDTENVGVITQGELILIRDGKETRYRPGEWYHVPAQAKHEVETSEIEFWFKQ